MDCSPPGCSVHGILQARILEWLAVPSSRGSSPPRNQTHISYVFCIGRQVLYRWATGEALRIKNWYRSKQPCTSIPVHKYYIKHIPNKVRQGKISMISLICGIQNMTQRNLSTKQKQAHKHREQTHGYQTEEVQEAEMRSLRLADAHCYIQTRQTTRSYCGGQGTRFNILH